MDKSPNLFGETPFDPYDEWVGMPEYESKEHTAYAKIIFRSRNKTDIEFPTGVNEYGVKLVKVK